MNLNISKKSWHYRWLDRLDMLSSYREFNTCSYTRAIFKGIFFTLFLLLCAFITLLLGGDTLGWLAVLFTGHWVVPDELAFIVVVLAMIFCVFYVIYHVTEWKDNRRHKIEDGEIKKSAIEELWESFKEKTCKKVTFVD